MTIAEWGSILGKFLLSCRLEIVFTVFLRNMTFVICLCTHNTVDNISWELQ